MNNAFEYDPRKSSANKDKHGIDFETAQLLWKDPFAISAPTKQVGEENRFIIVGLIAKKSWSAIFVIRDTTIRIISIRRSRKEEVHYYEKNKSQRI